jgi:hypothetical protein
LNISKYLLIGHLHALWWWGLDNADNDGCLGETFPEEIAEAAGWPVRRASEFVNALLFTHFLDETESGYVLHNWRKYAGKLNEKKEKDRRRKAEVAANSSGIPTEVAANSQAPNLPDLPTKPTIPNLPTRPTGIDGVCADFAQFGVVNQGTVRAIEDDVEEYGLEWVKLAVKKAAMSGATDRLPWGYVNSILIRWKKQGGPDEPKDAGSRPRAVNAAQPAPSEDGQFARFVASGTA